MAVKVWQRALESCWECSSLCYTPIQCQTTYYCSKPTSLRCHLMAKCCLKVSRNRNLRQEICQHVAVKVWQRALESCWECSSLCYTLIQCQSTTIVASLHLWGATWWPNVAWKWAEIGSEARNLPTCGCKSMTEGPTIMLGVFITLLYTYTMPNNHYCSKPTSLRCLLKSASMWL